MSAPTQPVPATGEVASQRRSVRAIIAGSAGTFIEWYDYGLYAFVAGVVFVPLFFPPNAGDAATLATFGAFAAGFVARPIGGLVLGSLADRWGRRPVLLASIVLVGLATAGIGMIPVYASVGVWAPVLLVVCRVLQGFATGAELGTAMVYVNESAQRHRKGYQTSFLFLAIMGGSILSVVMFAAFDLALGQAAFVAWGWRIPFLFAGVLTVVALLLRRRMEESEEFKRVEEARDRGQLAPGRANPFAAIKAAFMMSPRNYLAAFLMPTASNVIGYVANAFGITYMAKQLHMTFSETMLTLLVTYVAGVITLPLWGKACDRLGAKTVLFIGAISGLVFAFPYFMLLGTGNLPLIVLGSATLWALCWAPSVVSQLVIAPVLFKTESRAAGFTSSRELQQALVAGPTPLLAAALVIQLSGEPWLVAALIAAAQIFTIVSIWLSRPQLSPTEIAETPALRRLVSADNTSRS